MIKGAIIATVGLGIGYGIGWFNGFTMGYGLKQPEAVNIYSDGEATSEKPAVKIPDHSELDLLQEPVE